MSDHHEPWISAGKNDPRTEEQMRADYFRKIAEAKQPASIIDYGWGPLIVKPTLEEMIDAAQIHQMTPAEIEAQRQSFARGMNARCEHGELDFEQCPKCRVARRSP